MQTIVNVKKIFVSSDFNELVELNQKLLTDPEVVLISKEADGQTIHRNEVKLLAHRLYTNPQKQGLYCLEADYYTLPPTPPIDGEA